MKEGNTMALKNPWGIGPALSCLGGAALLCLAAFSTAQGSSQGNQPAVQGTAKAFATPQKAAEALVAAADPFSAPALLAILGPDAKELVSSADPIHDKSNAEEFASKAREKSAVKVDRKNPDRATLLVGKDDWPFPIPLVRKAGKWRFDTKAGRSEILARRIGGNELDAIQVCRGFVEAQREYASEPRGGSGIAQYAQKIFSAPGKQDGLYWENADGTPGGPVGRAIGRAIEEGYSPGKSSGYHGYFFKVLKGQGRAAPKGELDYVINGVMIGGFALVAVPVEYRVTGVKTFLVSHDGVIYERDLGPNSLKVVEKMERFNPERGWTRTEDQWLAATGL